MTHNIFRIDGHPDYAPTRARPLEIPARCPSPELIAAARELAFMSKADAASFCGVGAHQWRRWERGVARMPRATWGWYQLRAYGCAAAGGPAWRGWAFHKGKLWSPEGWGGFTAPELASWPYIHAQIANLKKQIRELQAKNAELEWRANGQRPTTLQGQLELVSEVLIRILEAHETAPEIIGNAGYVLRSLLAYIDGVPTGGKQNTEAS